MNVPVRIAHFTLIGAMLASCSASAERGADRPVSDRPHDVVLPLETDVVEGRVPNHATLDALLRANQVPADVTAAVVGAVRRVFNPRDLRANQVYRVTRGLDGAFRAFQYDIDADRFLSVVSRPSEGASAPAFDVEVVAYPREIVTDTVTAEITRERSSLSASLEARHENVQLALLLADVFGGEIDFNSDLQRGDRIDVLFERLKRNGEVIGYGDVEGAVLHNAGKEVTAVRFAGASGKAAWYDAQGRSLRRQFLRSPLPFEPRITSGYSNSRLHPVYGDYRPHLGVDYGAPAGTKVVAVAAGTVESAEWAGDGGRMVVIRHASGYETLYLHLSSFEPGIRPGARVSQGDLVGRVGMTGAATAPHLDYRIKKNGTYVNPTAELSRMPKGTAIPAGEMDAFSRERDRVLAVLSEQLLKKEHLP
jgi:murein DD-endopeptidase MepM/ murein hydrolase activator NlpD